MADILRRVEDRAHVGPGGAGWRTNDAAFSNATGRLNLITNAVMACKVEEDAPGNRNIITLLPNGLILITTAAAISGLAEVTTNLFTVPAGLNFQSKALFVRCTASLGIVTEARASAGIGGGAEVHPEQPLAGLRIPGEAYRYPTGGNSRIVEAGQVYGFTINLAATGTSQALEVQAYGRLFE